MSSRPAFAVSFVGRSRRGPARRRRRRRGRSSRTAEAPPRSARASAGSSGTARARRRRRARRQPVRPDRRRAARIAPPVRGELAVLPEDERLAAVRGSRGAVRFVDLGRELLAELDDEVAHPLAAGPGGVRRRAVGRRQLPPQRLRARRSGPTSPAGLGQGRPDRRQVLRAEPGLGGEVGQRRRRAGRAPSRCRNRQAARK